MFSSLSALSSSASASSSSVNSALAESLSTPQTQGLGEKIPLTTKEEVEKKLASALTQVQQNQIAHLDLTAASLGRFHELIHTLSGHESIVLSLLTFENSSTFISGSGYPENAIKLWDLASHSCLTTLRGHTDIVSALVTLPNSQLASGSYDNTIKIWDLASGSCLYTLREHTDYVYALTALPNSQIASGSQDKTIKIWDLASHSCLSTLRGHTGSIYTLTSLPNGHLVSGSQDYTIKIWDLTTRSCLYTLEGHTDYVFALNPLANNQLASGSHDNTIKIWDLTSHSCLGTFQRNHSHVEAVAVMPNGWFASGSQDKTIKVWGPKTLSVNQLPAILNALKNNTSVTDLDLSGNRDILDDIRDPLISLFTPNTSSGLKPNTTLKAIDLRATGVSKKVIKELEKTIQHQRLSVEILADCPLEWMIIYFLIVFYRANRKSPFADSGLDICKYGDLRYFLGIPSDFFVRPHKTHQNTPSSKRIALSPG